MEEYHERRVPISPTLESMARRLNLDVESIADEAITNHFLNEAVKTLTARMASSILGARDLAQQLGHSHIGCEHVFLAMLLDNDSIPSQLVSRPTSAVDLIDKLRSLLESELYNRRVVS